MNQAYDTVREVDLTAGIDEALKAEADEWLANWVHWHAEQLQVIQGIKAATGGTIIVMGPAGTGKTMLQQALSIYFYKLGFHVLALSPANSNCDHLASEMVKHSIPGLSFLRLYPCSRDLALADMNEIQCQTRRPGHLLRHVLPFPEFIMALEEYDKGKGFARQYGLVESVVSAAEQRRLKLQRRLRDARAIPYGQYVNIWDVLREFMDKYRAGDIDVDVSDDFGRYKDAYRACKEQLIGLSRYMITTTGNVRSHEMLTYWAGPETDWGVPCKGVIVFVDEAAKDQEINIWAGILAEKWASKVKGVFMFRDDKCVFSMPEWCLG